jgi:hypothetical protein
MSEQLARRLLLMTVALEDALARECWQEVDEMFRRRKEIVDQLESCSIDKPALEVIQNVRTVDDRIAVNLRKGMALVSGKLRLNKTGRKAVKAYAHFNVPASHLDRVG